MSQSAFKKYLIDNDITSGDITTGSFTDTGNGSTANPITINYLKIGKLYFGFWSSGGVYFLLGDSDGNMAASIARVASKLGIIVDTSYTGTDYVGATGRHAIWNGAAWQTSNANQQNFIQAILST